MAPKSVTFQRHDHLVSVLFGDLLSHSYNITFYNVFVSCNYTSVPFVKDLVLEAHEDNCVLFTQLIL